MMRVLCRLLGCTEAGEAPCCYRCGAAVYDDRSFVEAPQAWLWPLIRLRHVVRYYCVPRCHSCGRRRWPVVWRWKWWQPEHCSEACFKDWVPF